MVSILLDEYLVGSHILLVIVLPLAILKQMLTGTRQRLGLSVIFGLVVFNIVFEILRTVYSLSRDAERFPDQYDMWCFLQATSAVTVCALPCYAGLLSRRKMSQDRLVHGNVLIGPSPARSWLGKKTEESDRCILLPA